MFSIKNNNKYELEVKSSKFISLLYRVYTPEEVQNILNNIKKEYPGATHYCYAYIIDGIEIAKDDGEPAKTAGYPILSNLKNNNLNYVLLVVVRYFGGTKLGAPLLTRTYSKAAKEVIEDNNIITLIKGYQITLTFNYNNVKDIDYLLSSSNIINKKYEDNIIYDVIIEKELLSSLTNYNYEIKKEVYIEKRSN